MAGNSVDLAPVGVWTGAFDGVTSADACDAAVGLEAAGISALWIPETVGRDPFVTAALLLRATSTPQGRHRHR
jgi:alkanesulfonate monooxygenase SsuD/methylene tetrahydromethanopterin reductase-like flavin-dependent oxidoreductase (luciferase family)